MTKADRNTGVAVEHTFYKVSVGRIELEAILSVPNEAQGIVLFAHGSGSTHRSPRNRFVADVINEASLATLLIDLLSSEEQQVDLQTAHLRFNIPFLADRLTAISDWLDCQKAIRDLPLGLFGASTGAAAAIVTAVKRRDRVRAIASRGGRPDLADRALERVEAPTILIVGGADTAVIELNRRAMVKMHCPCEIKIVPGATHLFEEPGALEQVSELARDWFTRWLAPGKTAGLSA